jgi:protein-S-isoprenylcysteine O-methyltransferase Ste14
MSSGIIETLFFTVLGAGTITLLIPAYLLGPETRAGNVFCWIGLLPIAVGTFLYLWSAWTFVAIGRGTPAPTHPPCQLVMTGAYRRFRNPMYIGVSLVLVGESILFFSKVLLCYTLLVWFLLHLLVVWNEEPALFRKFGAVYADYCRNAPRWILSTQTRNHTGRRLRK